MIMCLVTQERLKNKSKNRSEEEEEIRGLRNKWAQS